MLNDRLRPITIWTFVENALSKTVPPPVYYNPLDESLIDDRLKWRTVVESSYPIRNSPDLTVREYDEIILKEKREVTKTTTIGRGKKRPNLDDGVRGKTFKRKAPTDEEESSKKHMSTMCVGLRPNKLQRQMLNLQVKVANHAYNWCLWLVSNGKCCREVTNKKTGRVTLYPDQVRLNKIVCCQKVELIPTDHRPFLAGPGPLPLRRRDVDSYLFRESDEWFFQSPIAASQTKVCETQKFVQSYAVHGNKMERKYRSLDTRFGGSFGVQRLYIKRSGSKSISMIPTVLSGGIKSRKGIKTDIDISKPVQRLPWVEWYSMSRVKKKMKTQDNQTEEKPTPKLKPGGPYLPHDCRVVKRPRSGKFVLNVPCDADHVRKPLDRTRGSNRVTSIDPGIRSFVTAFDAKTGQCWEAGTRDQQDQLLGKKTFERRYSRASQILSDQVNKSITKTVGSKVHQNLMHAQYRAPEGSYRNFLLGLEPKWTDFINSWQDGF